MDTKITVTLPKLLLAGINASFLQFVSAKGLIAAMQQVKDAAAIAEESKYYRSCRYHRAHELHVCNMQITQEQAHWLLDQVPEGCTRNDVVAALLSLVLAGGVIFLKENGQ